MRPILGRAIGHIARVRTGDARGKATMDKTQGARLVPTPYHTAVLALLAAKGHLNMMVVGANDGRINDPVYDLIRLVVKDRVSLTLIEPNRHLHPILRKNYSFLPTVKVLGEAIGPPGQATLYAVKQSAWPDCQPAYATNWPLYRAPTGVTSGNRAFVEAWLRRHYRGPGSPADQIEAWTLPFQPLDVALKDHGANPHPDILQIDAEGEDDTVIYHALTDAAPPSVLYFEVAHLADARRRALIAFLSQRGYVTLQQKDDGLAIRANR